MDKALADDAFGDWAEADQRFHGALVDLSCNARVQMICAMMSNKVRRAWAVALYMRPMPLKSNEDHRCVYEAIKSGNAQKAETIHRDHRIQAKKTLLGLL